MSQNPFDPNYRSETPPPPPTYQPGHPQYPQANPLSYPPPGYPPPPGYMPPYGYHQAPFGYQQPYFGQEELPQASSAQTCGIIGLVLFFNIIGIVLSIVALVQSSNAISQYAQYPGRYSEDSLRKAKTGRTCATVGLSLLGFGILVVLLIVVANA
jgi:hypothetical protein